MHRNQGGSDWRTKLAAFVGACAIGGALTGALLGSAGGALAVEERAAIASALAIVALFVGAAEFVRPVSVIQCDRETPQMWMEHGPLGWAARNGLVLGCGASTRIGFWLWYVIPAGALLAGDPATGAGIYGSYGLTRGVGALLLLAFMRQMERAGRDDGVIRILRWRTGAQRIAALSLVLIGTAVTAYVGL